MRRVNLVWALGLMLVGACGEQVDIVQCQVAADCDDGNACTTDSCGEDQRCDHVAVDVDDANACTVDSCDLASGEILHAPADVSDGDPCTIDACDDATGDVSHTPVDVDDDDACTTDACSDWTGEVTHAPVDADDGDACTTDVCDPATGVISHDDVAIDDSNACTVDACNSYSGEITHTAVALDDGDACTDDVCDPATGTITHAAVAAIDDDDACTADACDSLTGVVTHVAAAIDDANACTADACDTTTGAITHTPVAIDDEDACTVDACDPATGAVTHLPLPTLDDGIACTTDTCTGGSVTHTPVAAACDDGFGCTVDVCDAALGCLHDAQVGVCGLGQICSVAEGCVAEECYPGKTVGLLDEVNGATVYTSDQTNITSGTCGGATGPELALVVSPSLDLEVLAVFATATYGGPAPVVYVRGACADAGSELACSSWGESSPAYFFGATAGSVYYVIVDGDGPAHGWFDVRVEGTIASGGVCDPALPNYACGADHACKESAPGAGDWTCQIAACADGLDNDEDGFIDYPFEPSCESREDDDEALPEGSVCWDGIDNDGDGLTDWPGDYGCEAAGDGDEENVCAPGVPFLVHPGGTVMGNTWMSSGSPDLPCVWEPGATGDVWAFRVDRRYNVLYLPISTSFDAFFGGAMGGCEVWNAGCLGSFYGDVEIYWPEPPQGQVYFAIQGSWPGAGGEYWFTIRGEIAAGEPCTVGDPNFWCQDGFLCSPATETCDPIPACMNGWDDDGDGLADEWDPGCADGWDATEDPDPEPLPECADGLDNDGDGATDFGWDPECARASEASESPACLDGLDNDGDGLVDEMDPGCLDDSDDSEDPDPVPLPACADGLDNDGDSLVDYPDDPECARASDPLEAAGSAFGSDGFYVGLDLTGEPLPCDDISATGAATGLTDDSNTVVPIGFDFPFYGVPYADANLQSNGVLRFGDGGYLTFSNQCLPSTTSPSTNNLYVFWDDLNPSVAGDVYYQTLGAPGSQRFVVQWEVPNYGGDTSDLIRVQAMLEEATGNIFVCYPDTLNAGNSGNNGAEATAGIQRDTATALQYSCNTPSLTNGTLLLYSPM